MANIPDSYIYDVLSNVASKLNLTDWSYIRQTFETIAQNYFGLIIPVTLKGKQNSKDVTLHLALKLAPTDERYRVSGAVTVMFAREVFVYSELLKKYEDLQKDWPQNALFDMPRCYFVREEYCKEVIAMENMCEHGYLPFTQSRFLNLEQVVIGLKALAKLHALSFVLKEKDMIMYEKAKNVCVPYTNETNNRFMNIVIDRLTKALVKFEGSSYVNLLEILKNNCIYFIESAVYRVKNVCLCHGDIWKENILFKYKDNVPIAACLIDYQTMRMSSPAFDFLFLIISSVDASLRRQHYNKLLDTYYETFSKTLSNADLNSREIYCRDNLEHDLCVIGPATFIIANTALWLSSGLQEEGHVRSKNLHVTEAEKLKAVNEYRTIIRDIIDDLMTYGYLELNEILNK